MNIKINCEVCKAECEVNYCCDGSMGCGCGGMVDPPVCSSQCLDIWLYGDPKEVIKDNMELSGLDENPLFP